MPTFRAGAITAGIGLRGNQFIQLVDPNTFPPVPREHQPDVRGVIDAVVKKAAESGAGKVLGGPLVKVLDFVLGGGPGHIFQQQLGNNEEDAIAEMNERNAALAAALAAQRGGVMQDMGTSDP